MHKTVYKKLPFRWLLLGVILVGGIGAGFIGRAPVQAATGINEQVNYQGRLLTGTGAVVPDGTYNMEFKITQDGDGCNPTTGTPPCGGTVEWTETRTGANKVTVKNGYFSVYLGSVTAFSSSVDWNQDTLWLSVNIGGTGTPSWDGEMEPFNRLSATPYALNSKSLGGLLASNFLQLAQGSQTDSSTLSSVYINKTGASGNILELEKNAADVLVVDNTGVLTVTGAITANGGISIGSQTLTGSTGNIDYTNFDVAGSTGNTDIGGTITAGSGNEVITLSTGKIDADALTLVSAVDGRTGTSSASGLAVHNDGLALLQGCSDGQVLSWVESTDTWDCATPSGGGANTALSNLASVAINTSLLPATDDAIDLGDNTHRFRDAYLGGDTLHIGTSTTDEGVISYNTTTNVFSIDTDATGAGNITFAGGSGSTGCTVTSSTGAFACTSTLGGSNFSGSSSGTNTGDQTSVTGNAGTATALQNARTIGGVSFDGTANITVATATGGFTVSGGTLASANHTITSTSANALAVGANGTTNPALNVDASTASSATGLQIKSAAAAGGLAVTTLSSGTNEALTISAKGSGTLTLASGSTGDVQFFSSSNKITSGGALTIAGALSASNFSGSSSGTNTGDQTSVTGNAGTATALQNARTIGGVSFDGTANITVATATGGFTVSGGTLASANHTITSTSANALAVGANGTTNPALNVDASTASSATGLVITSKAAAAGVTLAAISSGTNEAFSIDAKGSGALNLGNTSTGDILLGGGSASTGCTVTNSTGAFACTAGLSGTTGTFSSAIAANGGITFDSAADTVGAHTLSGTLDVNANILTNIGNSGTDFVASTGALTLAGVLTANNGVSLGTTTLSGTTAVIDFSNFDVSSTGTQTFTGVTTDITTGTNEALTIAPNGTGDLIVSTDSDSWVGIGDTTPDGVLDVDFSSTSSTAGTEYNTYLTTTDTGVVTTGNDQTIGLRVSTTRTGATGGTIDIWGGLFEAIGDTAGSGASTTIGVQGIARDADINNGVQAIAQKTGTTAVTSLNVLYARADNTNASGTVTNAFGLYIDDSVETGTITNDWGVYQVDTGAWNYFGGKVGIGETSPGAALQVSADGVVAALFNRNTDDGAVVGIRQANVTEGSISVAGNTVTYGAFTGAHYARSDETIERGTIVTLNGENSHYHNNPDSEIIYGVSTSSKENDPKILGSFLSKIESSQPFSPDENPYQVMAVGNGDMWVAENEMGNIKVGDYFISSPVSGHAMKDNKRHPTSYIFARASEDVNWDNVTTTINGVKHVKITAFFESFARDNKSGVIGPNDNNVGNVATTSLGLDTIGQLNPVEYDNLTTGQKGLAFNVGELDSASSLLTVRDEDGNVQGINYEGFIAMLTNGVKELNQKHNSLKQDFNTTLGKEDASSTASPHFDTATIDNATISLNLTVNGALIANNSLSVNGLAEFNGQSIFDQLVTFDGPIQVNGNAEFAGRATFNNDSGGFAVVKAGQSEVKVTFTQPYAAKPVVTVNANDGQFIDYAYKDLTPTGFTIVLKEPAQADANFSWTALSVKNATTQLQ